MQLRSILRPWLAALAASAALLAACGGGGSSSSSSEPGMLRVALTDAPACGYEQVNVTVEKVRVHRSSTADDADAGWSEVVLNPARRVNLLDLTNGVLAELGQTELPAGTYSQLRLQLASNGNSAPYANSIVLEGEVDEIPLDTPSAQQSGLKMNLNLTVEPNELADLVLDFDACKSVVKRGNSGRYNLKPVVSVLPRVRLDGLVAEGYVAPAIALGTTSVSLQQGGVPVRTTWPAIDGRFVLYPVPAGIYDLVVSAEGRVTAVMTGVPISESSRTFVTPPGTFIDPTEGTPRLATGVVSISGSTDVPLATVIATQVVDGTTVERGARNVDADTGGYALSLVTGAPIFVAYDPLAVALNFSEDVGNAGKFQLTAVAEGRTPVSEPIDVTGGDDLDRPLVFAP
ncbi:DUF4382 domain-containing protein [uncultured Piscinibacter sp.]|uniref:DUF4382 domain-containing protein n=1 Tax=uncultured Piscinibacter sp. TaxID=1131835 RepID=UPI002601ADB5|nr:DUF4382 domain-containing protein [uncultured Piscinibacter sp.]